MPTDPYLDLRRRVQRRMEQQLALADGEVSVERVRRQIEATLGLPEGQMDARDALIDALQDAFTDALVQERVRLSAYESDRLCNLIAGDLVGLGPLDFVLADPGVTAAYVAGTEEIVVERGGELFESGAAFDDERQLDKIARRIFSPLGASTEEAVGFASGHLAGGSRVDAVLDSNVAPDGPQLAVRKRPPVSPDIGSLVEAGTMPEDVADYLRVAIRARRNVLVAGPPRSGKWALLSALAGALPDEARLLAVERATEIAFEHEHLISLEGQPQQDGNYGAEAILRRAGDFQPDWVWVGEVSAQIAGAYVEMLSRANLCAALTVRAPVDLAGTPLTTRQALDRLVLLALQSNPNMADDLARQLILRGLDLLVLTGQDAAGRSLVVEVAQVARDITGTRLERLYSAGGGPTYLLEDATEHLTGEAAVFSSHRSAPAAQPAPLTQPLFDTNGTPSDQTLDDLFLVTDGRAFGLREEEGTPARGFVDDVSGEVARLVEARAEADDALVWSEERADGTRVALAQPPLAAGGPVASVMRFAARPGGLKRLADLGLVTRESGTLLVSAARQGRSVLFCGPAGSGKRALMQGLLKVLDDADTWQVMGGVDALTLPALLGSAGQAKMLVAVDCAEGADPLAAISGWRALWEEDNQPASLSTLAGGFDLLVRMGRVGGRQRMILGIEQIIAQGAGYRLEPLFAARPAQDSSLLTIAQVGQASF